MARDFKAFPFAPYNGAYSSKSFNSDRGLKGIMLPLDILWPSYLANGQVLGTNNPNFAVSFNLNTAGPNSISAQWYIQSVYIDNEAVDFPVYVYFLDTQFTVSCPANSAGWYQVFTNGRQGLISAIGISDAAVAGVQRTRLFFTDVAMVPSLDQEVQSAVDLRVSSPAISLVGGGNISQINVTATGSAYNNGNMSITGGGGSGATCHATLDQFGRVTGVVLTAPGSGYTGQPVIQMTGGQNSPPLYSAATDYPQGSIVLEGNAIYQSFATPGGHNINNDPAVSPNVWRFICITTQPASFNAVITSTFGSTLRSGNYGPAALGDQAVYYIDTLTLNPPDTFRDNIFGTPFAGGLIRLTSVFVAQLSGGTFGQATWVLENSANAAQFTFESAASAMTLLELSNCNIELDASLDWRLRRLAGSGISVCHGFTFTQNGNI